MKLWFRMVSVLLLVFILATAIGSLLLYTLPQRSLQAGAADPTNVGYLPVVLQAEGQPSTPVATITAVVPTATPNPNEFDVVEFAPLPNEQPALEYLAAQQAHLYPIIFEYDGAITITAVAEPTINLVLEIIDSANAVVQQANSGSSGDLEAIVDARLDTALAYKIRIYDLNGAVGNYCLIFSEDGGFPDLIKGRIDYGQTQTDQFKVLGINYWCFMGANGDNVSISVSPTGSDGDLVIGLFGPPDFDAIGPAFQGDEILDVDLAADGMFIIGILDFDAGTPEYALMLTKN